MTEEMLETLVRQAMENAERRVSFAFQGGEPMVRGLPFYRRLIELEQKYARPGVLLEHSIQTNGTLITPEWAAFFRENNFLVGVSMDGTRELHNANRIDTKGKGSWDPIVKNLQLLQRNQVEVNLLCVVTAQVARRAQAVYQSLKKLGVRYLQFIPCLDPMEEARGGRAYSLTPEKYGQFLCTLFDQWYQDWANGDYVSIRFFDDYVHLLTGQPAGTCATAGHCGQYFVVEGDGSVYPCDFFVLDELCMGRLGEQSLAQLAQSPIAAQFCAQGRGAPNDCAGCRWLRLCNGGCRRDWIGMQRNYHCSAMQRFFAYAAPRLQQIAQLEMRARRNYS